MRQVHKMLLGMIGLALVMIGNTAIAAGPGNNITVRLVGSNTAYPATDLFEAYGIAGAGTAANTLCWDLEMLDIKTGESVGDVTDCAEIIGVVETDLGDGFQVIGTTFFHFPGGTVVSEVYTTAMPKTHGSPTFSHITGAVPAEDADNVLYGDGKFQGASGRVRFSGGGDLSTIFLDGRISVNCIFTLDINTGN